MELLQVGFNLAVAGLLGAAVGIEREWHQRLAGLRTNALVALGAASFVASSVLMPEDTSPTRVAAQVASGIGFLGAGVILREGLNVRGLNTAATLWCSAAVGVFAGAGYVLAATICTLLILSLNVGLRPIVKHINSIPINSGTEIEQRYSIRVVCQADREAFVRALLLHGTHDSALRLVRLDSHHLADSDRVEVVAELMANERADDVIERVAGRLSLEPTVHGASWRIITGDEYESTRPLINLGESK